MKTTLKWNGYCHMAANFCTGCSNDLSCRPTCWARNMARRLAAGGGQSGCGACQPCGLVSKQKAGAMLAGLPYARQLQRRGDPFWPALHLDVMARWDKKLAGMKTGKRIALNFMSDIGSAVDWDVYGDDSGSSQAWPGAAVQVVVRQFCERHTEHTFLVLTKRPEALISPWPANVHVGVGASTMVDAIGRGHELQRVVCGLRWLSLEPWDDNTNGGHTRSEIVDMLTACRIGWVVIGGWSSNLKRMSNMVAEQVRHIVVPCKWLGVPVFLKSNLPFAAWPHNERPMEIPE